MIKKSTWNFVGSSGAKTPDEHLKISELNGTDLFQFRLEIVEELEVSNIYLDIEFESPISHWRYLDYTWKKAEKINFISNSHSPKVVRLESGDKMVAQNNLGCWELLPKQKALRWHFYHPMLTPTMTYDVRDERTFLKSQKVQVGTVINSGLIWGRGKVEEWARTPLGFVPTVCFTDHCDFDTLENLRRQRIFFRRLGIRITKGFFLFDYTHKAENASFEDESSKLEYLEWEKDGHELAYHALSQSYRGRESDREFQEFCSPIGIAKVDTYIDHGFHPYNYTKQNLGDWDAWYTHMAKKGIRRIWTYVDAGEANFFNTNQINPLNFTWSRMRESSILARNIGVKRSRRTALRDFLMYGVAESVLREGKYLGGSLAGLKSGFSGTSFYGFLRSLVSFIAALVRPENIREIVSKSKEVFPVNRFGTLFFRSPNQRETGLDSFQSLAVRDYELAFSELAIDGLVAECGVMIAHTYFSYTGANHEGRLYDNENWDLRPEAVRGFERLGRLIDAGRLWNPTLREMHRYYDQFAAIEYVKVGEDLRLKKFNGVRREIEE